MKLFKWILFGMILLSFFKGRSQEYPVKWANIGGAVFYYVEDSLRKNVGSGWGSGGGISINKLKSYENGRVTYTVHDTVGRYFIGLAEANTTENFTDIDFSIYHRFNDYLVYESGVVKKTVLDTLSIGDKLVVERKDSAINFYLIRDTIEVLIYTSASTADMSKELKADCVIYTQFTSIVGVTASFDYVGVNAVNHIDYKNGVYTGGIELTNFGSMDSYQVEWDNGVGGGIAASNFQKGVHKAVLTDTLGHKDTISASVGYMISWEHLVGVTFDPSENELYKTGGYGWNAGALSVAKLDSLEDGWVEFDLTSFSVDERQYVGLAKYNTVATMASIDFAAYALIDDFRVYEKGVSRYIKSDVLLLGDQIYIERVGTNINYGIIREGRKSKLYTSTATVDPNDELYVDCVLYVANQTLTDVRASFELDFTESIQKICDTASGMSGILANNDRLGKSVVNVGDVDGDGYEDLLVGYNYNGNKRGGLFLTLLNEDLSVKEVNEISDSTIFSSLLSLDTNFCSSLQVLPDLDRDGKKEIYAGSSIVAHSSVDEYSNPVSNINQGKGYLFQLTATGDLEWLKEMAFITTVEDTVVTEAPMIYDKVVGDSILTWSQSIGSAVDSLQTTNREGRLFGFSAASIGDLDGNGVGDLAVGAPLLSSQGSTTFEGGVYILFLDDDFNVINHSEISTYSGGMTHTPDTNDVFGFSMTAIDDLNEDGISELVVSGADLNGVNYDGLVWVLYLDSAGAVSHDFVIDREPFPIDSGEFFGGRLETVYDMDGDGYRDVAITSFQKSDNGGEIKTGAVGFYSIKPNDSIVMLRIIESGYEGMVTLDASDQFGVGFGYLGNINNNGKAYFAVGANNDDDGGSNRGAVYLLGVSDTLADQLGYTVDITDVGTELEIDLFDVDITPSGGVPPYFISWNGSEFLNQQQFNYFIHSLADSTLIGDSTYISLSDFQTLSYSDYKSDYQTFSRTDMSSGYYEVYLYDSVGGKQRIELVLGDTLVSKVTKDLSLVSGDLVNQATGDGWGNYYETDNILYPDKQIYLQIEIEDPSTEYVIGFKNYADTLDTFYAEIKCGFGFEDDILFIINEGIKDTVNYGKLKKGDKLKMTSDYDNRILQLYHNSELVYESERSISLEERNFITKIKTKDGVLKKPLAPLIDINKYRPYWYRVEDANCGSLGSIRMNVLATYSSYTWEDENSNVVGTDEALLNVPPGLYTLTLSNGGSPVVVGPIEVAYKVSWINFNNSTTMSYPNENTLLLPSGPWLTWNIGDADSYNTLNESLVGWMDYEVKNQKYGFVLKFYGFEGDAGYNGFYQVSYGGTHLAKHMQDNLLFGSIYTYSLGDRPRLTYDGVNQELTYSKTGINPYTNSPVSTSQSENLDIFGLMLTLSEASGISDAKASFCPIAPSYVWLDKKLGNSYYKTYEDKLYVRWEEKYQNSEINYEIVDLNDRVVSSGILDVTLGTNYTTIDVSGYSLTEDEYYTLKVYNNKERMGQFKFIVPLD